MKGREGRPTATVGLTEAAAAGEQRHTQVLLVSITWQWIMVNVHDEAKAIRSSHQQQPEKNGDILHLHSSLDGS